MEDDFSFGKWQIEEGLFNWILSHLPDGKSILEFGSGWASGELSKHYTVYSVEHDFGWIDKFNTNYIYVPYNGNGWYDRKILEEKVRPLKYDLILVDGPEAYTRWKFNQHLDLFDVRQPIVLDDMQEEGIKRGAIELSETLRRPYEIIKGIGKDFMVIP